MTELHDFYAVNPDEGLALIGSLRPQPSERPNDPPGCGSKTKPCWANEPGRKPGEVWRAPFGTGSYIWYKQRS